MSAQPKPYFQPTTEFYVVLSDGRTPVGAVGPIDTRADATFVCRVFKSTFPGAFAGVATRRPAKGVSIVSREDMQRPCLESKALLDRCERVAAKLHPKPVTGEEGERGRDRR